MFPGAKYEYFRLVFSVLYIPWGHLSPLNMEESEDRQLHVLIDRVYDASVGNKAWCGLADKIALNFGSTSAVLKVQDTQGRAHLVDMTPNLVIDPKHQDWADHWQRNDLWVEKSLAQGMSNIVTSRELIPDAEFEQTNFYGDWIRHLEIYHMIGAVFPVGDDLVGVIGIHRPNRSRAYQALDRSRLTQFLPHLQRAFCLHQKLARSQSGAAAVIKALERAHSAIVIVDAHMSILFASRLAEQMIAQAREFAVTHGKLAIRQPGVSARLAQLITGCVQTASGIANSSGGAIAIQRGERLPLTLSVAPLHPAAMEQPAALIFIRDPEALTTCAETLRQLFGLTHTEAVVAEALAEGRGLTEIAESLSIGMGTVRSHLKKILSKTNTRKQAELVALLLRSAAGINF